MTRPIRFLHVTSFYPPYHFGGDAVYVWRLSQALAERGHVVDVVHCRDGYRLLASGRDRTPLRPEPSHERVTVHGLASRWGWLSPVASYLTGRPVFKRRALQHVLKRGVDVIHFHNASLFGPGVFSLGRGLPVITLYTTHEHWLICPTHVLWRFNRERCDNPTCFACTVASGRPPQLWRYTGLVDRAAHDVDRFLSPSRFTADMHAARGFTRPMTHLPPFCTPADAAESSERPHSRPYFLFVGRLEAVKGVRSLVDVWTPDAEDDLLIVGDGSERRQIEQMAARNPRIRLVGTVPTSALGPYYRHAIASVIPSVVFEVAPTVVLESFAHSTPVIARAIGGAAELVRDGDGGLLYGSQDELRAALALLAGDRSTRDQMGERGYRAFTERWTPPRHLDRYLTLVDEVAREKLGHLPWRDGTRAALQA